ncbi:MAG: nucleoside phosphorylase [Clostridiaceae bacterium]|nr:nucleoside phosphorylase [Clostridiaceae bacterium]
MSIINTFDLTGEEIIAPSRVVGAIEGFPKTVLVVFTQKFADLLMITMQPEQVCVMSAGRSVPVYKFTYQGKELGFYHTMLGGAASAALLEEVIAMGAERFLFFGSCGALDKSITGGHLIVPTAAYRDEGASYHYAPAADYIEIETAGKLARIFDTMMVSYIRTKAWTTDGFYRETRRNTDARKKEGCAVVEMECASVMAVGQFRKKEVYQFLYAADCLDGDDWDQRILGNMPEDMRERILKVALETAIRL